MYRVAADVNNVQYKTVPLDKDYTLNSTKVLNATDIHTKVIFLCSPNNPTGNLLDPADVDTIVTNFQGIVVVDEAYIDFAPEYSWLPKLNAHPNLIVLQTFSKAWGLAAVRCGMAFANEEIVDYLNRVKYPYNVNLLTQQTVLEQLAYEDRKNEWVKTIVQQREWLKVQLQQLPIVDKVYHSDANFLLVKVNDANTLYQYLAQQGVVVRNRHTTELCENCIRITVGTQEENNILMQTLCKAVEGNELNNEHHDIYNI
jgi:histidinol-phosphate aminotransferase